MRIDSRMSIEIDPSELNEIIKLFQNATTQTFKKELTEQIDCIKQKYNQQKSNHNNEKYNEVVDRLKNDEKLFQSITKIIKTKALKNEVQEAISEQKISARLKRIIKIILIDLLDFPNFTVVNLGRLYVESDDKDSDILWGYLRMIIKQFVPSLKFEIGCIDMANKIHSLLMDLIGDARH